MNSAKRAEQSFSTGEVSRLTGVSHRTLDFWAKTKFIDASVRQAHGTGSDRLYSFADVVTLCIAGKLRNAGLETAAIAAMLEAGFMTLGVWKRGDVEIRIEIGAIIERLLKEIHIRKRSV